MFLHKAFFFPRKKINIHEGWNSTAIIKWRHKMKKFCMFFSPHFSLVLMNKFLSLSTPHWVQTTLFSFCSRTRKGESRFYVFFPCIFYDYGIIIAVWQPTTTTFIDDKVLSHFSSHSRCVRWCLNAFWIKLCSILLFSAALITENISQSHEIWDTKWQCHYNVMEIYSSIAMISHCYDIHTTFYCRHYITLKSGKNKRKIQ
jgi:hypothetical protein